MLQGHTHISTKTEGDKEQEKESQRNRHTIIYIHLKCKLYIGNYHQKAYSKNQSCSVHIPTIGFKQLQKQSPWKYFILITPIKRLMKRLFAQMYRKIIVATCDVLILGLSLLGSVQNFCLFERKPTSSLAVIVIF